MNIVAERLNRGLSVLAAADEIGISHVTLRKAESGEQITPSVAKKIADFYGCLVTDIWPVDPPARVAA